MAIVITPDEIREYGIEADEALIQRVIADAIDQAELIAPGVNNLDEATSKAVAAVIRGAVARYIEVVTNAAERGGAASSQDTAGPFSHQDSYRERTSIFLPSEERKIANAVRVGKRKAFMVDMAPPKNQGFRCGLCAPGECLGWVSSCATH